MQKWTQRCIERKIFFFFLSKIRMSAPKTTRSLRACLFCSMVKQKDQFYEKGCNNCKFLELEHDYERIQLCTTENFQGFIAMADPKTSWVSRWQRLGAKFAPGCYAISVSGSLPDDIIEEIEASGFKYLSRDTSM